MPRITGGALGDAAQRTLLFPGVTRLLTFLDGLVRRPRRWGRQDTLLPVVVIVGGRPDRSPLLGIEERLRATRHCMIGTVDPQQPCSGAERHSRRQQTVLLVDKAVAELSGTASGVRRVRFPHHAVATWLVNLLMRPPEEHGRNGRPDGRSDRTQRHLDDEFKAFIRDRYRLARAEDAVHNVATDVPWWIRWPILAAPGVGLLLIRSVWSAPRWFRKQRIGTIPAGSFTRLARGLAEHHDDGQIDDAVRELVVDAFLQDLRRAWRRSSLLGAGRRRLLYPVLILQGRPGSDAVDQFVMLLTTCRNRQVQRRDGKRTARWDPLLAITAYPAGAELPDLVEHQPSNHPTNSQQAYSSWLARRDASAPDDREQPLVFRITEQFCAPDEADPVLRRDEHGYLDDLLGMRQRRLVPPIGPLLAVIVLVAAAVIGGTTSYLHCGRFTWTRGFTWTSTIDRERDTNECVGVATGGYRYFADLSRYGTALDPALAAKLRDAEERIARQNDQIVDDPAHRTIVYLSVLTPKDPRSLESEREGLRGLHIAQLESIRSRAPLRILLANTGDGLDKATEAVDSIRRAAEADPTIVAVTGLGISVDATRIAVSQLANLRLTTVGTLLSATDLATQTPQYYHQVGPTNTREARVAAYFARDVRTAKVYYSGNTSDRYSSDLAFKFRDAMTSAHVELLPYESQVGRGDGRPVDELGQDACDVPKDRTGLVFYAGRSERLQEFLNGMKSTCEGTYPRVLLGDDVNRFAVDSGFHDYPGLDVSYVSFASSLSWPGANCEGARDRSGFYRKYLEVFDDCGATREGTAASTYDAALVVRRAIERARQDTDTPPSSDLILGKINEMSEGNGVTGASGRFEITKRYGNGRVPVDKAILVVGAGDQGPPTEVLLCGKLDTADPPPDRGCPVD